MVALRTKVETVKKLVASYFNVVRKQLVDQVPKTVIAYLVKGVLQDLQSELVRVNVAHATYFVPTST